MGVMVGLHDFGFDSGAEGGSHISSATVLRGLRHKLKQVDARLRKDRAQMLRPTA